MGTVLALDAATLLNACGGSTPPHDPMWVVTTLAGSEFPDFADGKGALASFYGPNGMAADISGQLYVADTYNNRIRKISPAGVVSTLAGSTTSGSADGTAASFNYPYGVAVDGSGNVFVADQRNHLIRQISPSGEVSTLAGSGSAGSDDDTGTAASFSSPQGVAVDDHGYVFVADYNNHLIRQINPE
ncbi:MAG: hypothetical protein RIT26_793, partial [Pseudomonadota bacterium]